VPFIKVVAQYESLKNAVLANPDKPENLNCHEMAVSVCSVLSKIIITLSSNFIIAMSIIASLQTVSIFIAAAST